MGRGRSLGPQTLDVSALCSQVPRALHAAPYAEQCRGHQGRVQSQKAQVRILFFHLRAVSSNVI